MFITQSDFTDPVIFVIIPYAEEKRGVHLSAMSWDLSVA